MILGIRTDKPEAELYLLAATGEVLASHRWQAHRELSDTLLSSIESILHKQAAVLQDLSGIVVYQGPGSFTGLRIGIATANALSYSLVIPIAAAEGESWQAMAFRQLADQPQSKPIIPAYGSPVHITKPRK